MPTVQQLNFAAQALLRVLNSSSVSISEEELCRLLGGGSKTFSSTINRLLRQLDLEPDEHGRYLFDLLCGDNTGHSIVLDYSGAGDTKIAKAARGFDWIAELFSKDGKDSFSATVDKVSRKVVFRRSNPQLKGSHVVDLPLRLVLSFDYSKARSSENFDELSHALEKILFDLKFVSFSSTHPNFAFLCDFSSYTQLQDSLSELLQALNTVVSGHLLVSIHFTQNLVSESTYEAVDKCRQLCRLHFDQYYQAIPENGAYPVLLASAEAGKILEHRFSLEPVGEELLACNPRPVVYRVWADIMQGRSTDTLLELPSKSSRTMDIRVTEVAELQKEARLLVLQLGQNRESQVMYWDCNAGRTHDLLRPFDEALSSLMGLHRRSTFVVEGQAIARVIQVKQHIHAFLARFLSGNADSKLSGSIKSLIVGGADGRDFESLTKNLSSLIHGLCDRSPVDIVVDNYDEADELLCQLLQLLDTELPPACRLRIFRMQGGASNPPQRKIVLNEHAQRLLKIAAVLGYDFRLTWLRELWLKMDERRSIVDPKLLLIDFDNALSQCLQASLLQHCDSLVGGNKDEEFLVQLKWTWRSEFSHFTRTLELEFRQRVAYLFWEWLDKERHDKHLKIEDHRLKCRTFAILDEITDRSILSRFMFDLGYVLTFRATVVNAPKEAGRRFAKTLHWFKKLNSPAVTDYEQMQKLATTCLFVQENEVLDSEDAPVEFLNSELDRQSNHSSQVAVDELIKLPKALWSLEFRRGRYTEAMGYVDRIAKLATASPRADLCVMEASHTLAVTAFSMAKFNTCLTAAEEGIRCCDSTRSSHLEVGELHGSHDGRVCCKMYKGLAMQALGQAGATHWITEALEFSASKDANTKTLRRAFTRLYYLIDGSLEKATADELQVCERSANQIWTQFFNLTQYCVEVAIHWNDRRKLEDVVQKMNTELVCLRSMEFGSLWAAFLALANWRIGESEFALASLAGSVDQATARKELAHLCFCNEVQEIIRSPTPSQITSPLLKKLTHQF